MTKMPAAASDEIKLKIGASATIKLNGLATAGYIWNYTTDDDKDCIKVSKDYAHIEKSIPKKMGASADEVFTITAQKRGTVHIHFSQQRSWEKADPANAKKVTVIIE